MIAYGAGQQAASGLSSGKQRAATARRRFALVAAIQSAGKAPRERVPAETALQSTWCWQLHYTTLHYTTLHYKTAGVGFRLAPGCSIRACRRYFLHSLWKFTFEKDAIRHSKLVRPAGALRTVPARDRAHPTSWAVRPPWGASRPWLLIRLRLFETLGASSRSCPQQRRLELIAYDAGQKKAN